MADEVDIIKIQDNFFFYNKTDEMELVNDSYGQMDMVTGSCIIIIESQTKKKVNFI